METFIRLFFSPQGRLRRRTYYWTLALLTFVFCVLFIFLETTINRGSTLVLYPPFLWCCFALTRKRMHDREQSAWWLTLVAIPVAGPVLLAAWLFLGRGTRGDNRFGADPRAAGAGYLTVSIGR